MKKIYLIVALAVLPFVITVNAQFTPLDLCAAGGVKQCQCIRSGVKNGWNCNSNRCNLGGQFCCSECEECGSDVSCKCTGCSRLRISRNKTTTSESSSSEIIDSTSSTTTATTKAPAPVPISHVNNRAARRRYSATTAAAPLQAASTTTESSPTLTTSTSTSTSASTSTDATVSSSARSPIKMRRMTTPSPIVNKFGRSPSNGTWQQNLSNRNRNSFGRQIVTETSTPAPSSTTEIPSQTETQNPESTSTSPPGTSTSTRSKLGRSHHVSPPFSGMSSRQAFGLQSSPSSHLAKLPMGKAKSSRQMNATQSDEVESMEVKVPFTTNARAGQAPSAGRKLHFRASRSSSTPSTTPSTSITTTTTPSTTSTSTSTSSTTISSTSVGTTELDEYSDEEEEATTLKMVMTTSTTTTPSPPPETTTEVKPTTTITPRPQDQGGAEEDYEDSDETTTTKKPAHHVRSHDMSKSFGRGSGGQRVQEPNP